MLQFYCVLRNCKCRSQWNGCAKVIKVYLFCSSALRVWLCFADHCRQIAILLHQGCDLNVRICTKHCNMFFRVNRGSVAEKSWLACATGAGVAALARNHAWSARPLQLRSPSNFFSSLLMLCYCALQLRIVNRIVVAAWRLGLVFGQQNFSILALALMIFLVNFLSKSASNSSFLRFGVEIFRFWSCNLCSRCVY